MSDPTPPRVVTGRSARNTATWMDYGNLVAVAFPPIVVLWIAASMLIFALNRHHPNPRVGHYTQWAAYRLYGVTGAIVAMGFFIPESHWGWYWLAWAGAALIIVPWTIVDLVRIYRERWEDVVIEQENASVADDAR
jgi:hypothetical protein